MPATPRPVSRDSTARADHSTDPSRVSAARRRRADDPASTVSRSATGARLRRACPGAQRQPAASSRSFICSGGSPRRAGEGGGPGRDRRSPSLAMALEIERMIRDGRCEAGVLEPPSVSAHSADLRRRCPAGARRRRGQAPGMARGGVHLWRGVRRERPRRPDDPQPPRRGPPPWWPPSRRSRSAPCSSRERSRSGTICAGSARRHAQGDRGGGRDDRRHERGPGRHRHAGRMGIELLDQRPFLGGLAGRERLLVPAAQPTEAEWAMCRRGLAVRAARGRRTGGQTVVVKRGAVVAVEAIEGTTETIARHRRRRKARSWSRQSRADHDYRFGHADRRSRDDRGGAGRRRLASSPLEAGRGAHSRPRGVPARRRRAGMALVGVDGRGGRRRSCSLDVRPPDDLHGASLCRALRTSTRADVSRDGRGAWPPARNGPPRGR